MTPSSHILARPDGATIDYEEIEGTGPGLVFLHGLNSDRGGTKARALQEHCRTNGRAFLTFDMFGHGESTGIFSHGGIGRWTEDTVAVLDALTSGPQVLIGSSMGGWVMLRAAMECGKRVAGLIGIAAAPDFTEDLIWESMTEDQQRTLLEKGFIEQPNDYDEDPFIISRYLIEDGRSHLVLRNPIDISVPVRLIHGQKDIDVPWKTALRLADILIRDDVDVVLVKDGDHRLSRPQDLQRLCKVVDDLLSVLEGVA